MVVLSKFLADCLQMTAHQVFKTGLTATPTANQYVVDRADLGNGVGFLLAGSFALGTVGYLFADRLTAALPSSLSSGSSSRADYCECSRPKR